MLTFSRQTVRGARKANRQTNLHDDDTIPCTVVMVVDAKLRESVEKFAANEDLFFSTFARAYQRLVSIGTSHVY